MSKEIVIINPLDTRYTAHRDEERRRQETREWLKQREQDLATDALSMAAGKPIEKN